MAHKKEIKRVKKFLLKWLKPLGLLWWAIEVDYYSDPDEIMKNFKTDTSDVTLVMKVFADWRYSEAIINVNLLATRKMNDDKLERTVVHELAHVLVNEMREGEIKHEERVVSTLTKAFFWCANPENFNGENNG